MGVYRQIEEIIETLKCVEIMYDCQMKVFDDSNLLRDAEKICLKFIQIFIDKSFEDTNKIMKKFPGIDNYSKKLEVGYQVTLNKNLNQKVKDTLEMIEKYKKGEGGKREAQEILKELSEVRIFFFNFERRDKKHFGNQWSFDYKVLNLYNFKEIMEENEEKVEKFYNYLNVIYPKLIETAKVITNFNKSAHNENEIERIISKALEEDSTINFLTNTSVIERIKSEAYRNGYDNGFEKGKRYQQEVSGKSSKEFFKTLKNREQLKYLNHNKTNTNSWNFISLFSGCGGLTEGFMKEGYNLLGAVEWQKHQTTTLEHRLSKVYGINGKTLRFDIQRTEELIYGWNDNEYNDNRGLNALVNDQKVEIIIGGAPCQAYSITRSICDKNGINDNYRNSLFESYLKVVEYYKPKIAVFESIEGILTAKPGGISIFERIKEGFDKVGYTILDNLKQTVFNCADYGVPQNRKRVVIIALKNDSYLNPQEHLNEIYFNIMPKYIEEKVSVKKAIGDLPKLKPLVNPIEIGTGRAKFSHTFDTEGCSNHEPRFHNERDIKIFRMLAKDKAKPIDERQYNSINKLKNLYTQVTGKTSNIHKYFVIPWEGQSNTIVAHLKKDGLRHIHPDPEQGRSITVREAARLQTFDDDYEFLGPRGIQYEMVGNAVPPKFSSVLAKVVKEFLMENN